MKRGFYTIMAAQFFSSLADNALLPVAVQLLRSTRAPAWQEPALITMFAVFYVVLAPFVGEFADSMHKRKVMLISNGIKVLGCLLLLLHVHPLLAYAVVGLGAAIYSPAKYGILTELLPASQLVKANGWIEGLTIASIILGVLLGGQLLSPAVSGWLMAAFATPWWESPIRKPVEAALLVITLIYGIAAWINTRVPLTGVKLYPMPSNPLLLLPDFWQSNRLLWTDKLGQISLAATTLIWGVAGNLRIIVLSWAALALGYSITQASNLQGVVAIGMAVGALVASMKTKLQDGPRLLAVGIWVGAMVFCLTFVRSLSLAIPLLMALGALGGFLVVPMNALLQHRGAILMSSGRSIAVQNFNEQACILLLSGMYSFATGLGLPTMVAIASFGVLIMVVMALIKRWYALNLRNYPVQMDNLLQIASGKIPASKD